MILRLATPEDAAPCAAIQGEANRVSLPFLPRNHTFEEAIAFFAGTLLPRNETWIAEADGTAVGYVAFHPGSVEHLYVLPDHQGRGLGPALLAKALADGAERRLWTFQKNLRARAFYEKRGFVLERLTDGAGNMEKEPDALYFWRP